VAVGEVVVMRVLSDVFKRCSCRDGTGRLLNGRCLRLVERGHGSWYFRLELPRGQDGRRRQLRRGGFTSRSAARQARDYLGNPAAADPSAAVVTTGQWLSLWVDMRLGTQRSTLRGYRQHIRAYLKP